MSEESDSEGDGDLKVGLQAALGGAEIEQRVELNPRAKRKEWKSPDTKKDR